MWTQGPPTLVSLVMYSDPDVTLVMPTTDTVHTCSGSAVCVCVCVWVCVGVGVGVGVCVCVGGGGGVWGCGGGGVCQGCVCMYVAPYWEVQYSQKLFTVYIQYTPT